MELDEFMNAYFKALGSFVARKGLDPASFSAGLKVGTAAMAENDGGAHQRRGVLGDVLPPCRRG